VDDITNLQASKIPGHDDNLGGNFNPFPAAPSYVPDNNTPGGNNFTEPPNVQDTVLRTNALNLGIIQAGTQIPQDGVATPTSGPEGSQNEIAGQSGGQANLFGNIPGKSYGVDATVSLGAKIWSLVRSVASDAGNGLVEGLPWPPGLFNCRQAITGYVQNYIPGVRLQGNLHISPAVTPGGQLRIAKANLASPPSGSIGRETHIALAACLSLYSALDGEQNNTDTAVTAVPFAAAGPSSPYTDSFPGAGAFALTGYNFLPPANEPATSTTRRDSGGTGTSDVPNETFLTSKTGACNSTQTQLTKSAGFTGIPNVTDTSISNVTPNSNGSKVSVAGALTVNNVDADVLIGDV
jgi:hypothetical protein